ncbi:hypothetical protein HK100_003297 [Physocladia obscura]|uniref:Uncharacterized protein n=1 Tax=Physocladia obscura TaxID=109957 RepID=A0AAD5XEP9_9FUNG|nr:hypothetical protein HK100_003297 [Physocladia obscura]
MDTCLNIHTTFRLGDGWVKVIKEMNCERGYIKSLTRSGRIKKVVALGSIEHQQALIDRLAEIETKVARLEASLPDAETLAEGNAPSAYRRDSSVSDNNDNCDFSISLGKSIIIAKLKQEAKTRLNELEFIRTHCNVVKPDQANDLVQEGDDELTIPTLEPTNSSTNLDSQASSSNISSISTPSVEEFETIRVTHETFGEILHMREYSIKKKEKLFRRPKVRQFFVGKVLHRSTDELHTSWQELFVDLLYVGIFSSAGTLIAPHSHIDF